MFTYRKGSGTLEKTTISIQLKDFIETKSEIKYNINLSWTHLTEKTLYDSIV